MHVDKIDKYFADKGVKVIYNCLGHNENLVRSYVKKFQKIVDSGHRKESQHVKHSCYSTMYELSPRSKFTGFEKFKPIDRNFRKHISPLITEPQFSPTFLIDNKDNQVCDDYKSELKKFLSTIDNPILYLSGGIDSELVALTMIDNGVKFLPVIVNYVNNSDESLNLFDVNYAYKFCAKHNLYPITKTINIEELWNSKEFAELAIDLQIVSPHLVTHAYMVELMKNQFPDYTHVFGGEVRFITNYQLDDGRMANLVLLAKINPTYNGNTYYASSLTTIGAGASAYLAYSNDGSWEVRSSGWDNGAPLSNVLEASGTWTTTPGSAYEYAIWSVSLNPLSGPSYSYSPTGTTAYSPIGSYTTICSATVNPSGSGSFVGVTWSIFVRAAGKVPEDVPLSTSITIDAEYAP